MVMACAQQGDILWLDKEEQYVLVLSREFFNHSGMSVVCPLRDNAKPGAFVLPCRPEHNRLSLAALFVVQAYLASCRIIFG